MLDDQEGCDIDPNSLLLRQRQSSSIRKKGLEQHDELAVVVKNQTPKSVFYSFLNTVYYIVSIHNQFQFVLMRKGEGMRAGQDIIFCSLFENPELDERFKMCFYEMPPHQNEDVLKDMIKRFLYAKIIRSLGKSNVVAMANTANISAGEGASIRKQNSINSKKYVRFICV